ncbi:hypothetical protein V1477_002858 [Vespula maculifrons]|uniref:Uncharacterized protein n=1 Tax=Vespula maculifrons TaxID=7453 RepID=A0ABD2CV20_VESMC
MAAADPSGIEVGEKENKKVKKERENGKDKEEKEKEEEEKDEEEKEKETEERKGRSNSRSAVVSLRKISPWLNKGRLVSEILPGYRPGPEINHHPEPNDPPSSTCHSETANHDSSVSIKEASQARRRHS